MAGLFDGSSKLKKGREICVCGDFLSKKVALREEGVVAPQLHDRVEGVFSHSLFLGHADGRIMASKKHSSMMCKFLFSKKCKPHLLAAVFFLVDYSLFLIILSFVKSINASPLSFLFSGFPFFLKVVDGPISSFILVVFVHSCFYART